MLVFLDARLLIYAPPKTGTTALHLALGGAADIAFRNDTKHMNVRKAQRKLLPLLRSYNSKLPEGFAVIREPIEWLHSWYRYRSRLDRSDPKSTMDITFDAFIDGYLSDEPRPWSKVGQQSKFLQGDGDLAIKYLFAYDHLDRALAFLFERLNHEFALSWVNESPAVPLSLSDQNRARLETHFAPDYALYKQAVTHSLAFEPPQ